MLPQPVHGRAASRIRQRLALVSLLRGDLQNQRPVFAVCPRLYAQLCFRSCAIVRCLPNAFSASLAYAASASTHVVDGARPNAWIMAAVELATLKQHLLVVGCPELLSYPPRVPGSSLARVFLRAVPSSEPGLGCVARRPRVFGEQRGHRPRAFPG